MPPEWPRTIILCGGAGRLSADLWVGPSPCRTVILAHGGGQTRHSWRRTAERLHHSGFTVLTFDARGHGESDWSPEGEYSFALFADDLRGVIAQIRRRLDTGPPVVVGASMGGVAGLMALATDADVARALVLVDVTPRIELAGLRRIREFVTSAPQGYASLEEASEAVASYNLRRPRPVQTDGLRKNLRRGTDHRYYWHWDPKVFAHPIPEAAPLAEQLAEAARAVSVPTLLIRGTESDIATEDGARTLVRLVPHARVAEVEKAGHMVAGDDNDVFSSVLSSFLDEAWTTGP